MTAQARAQTQAQAQATAPHNAQDQDLAEALARDRAETPAEERARREKASSVKTSCSNCSACKAEIVASMNKKVAAQNRAVLEHRMMNTMVAAAHEIMVPKCKQQEEAKEEAKPAAESEKPAAESEGKPIAEPEGKPVAESEEKPAVEWEKPVAETKAAEPAVEEKPVAEAETLTEAKAESKPAGVTPAMQFPSLDRESPAASMHQAKSSSASDKFARVDDEWEVESVPAVEAVSSPPATSATISETDAGFHTDEEYDVLDASDEEVL